jgi:hypothetical protein
MGINTSAQIEAGLIGRPVYTVLLPEFWDNQEGTLHFAYLTSEAPPQTADSMGRMWLRLAGGQRFLALLRRARRLEGQREDLTHSPGMLAFKTSSILHAQGLR